MISSDEKTGHAQTGWISSIGSTVLIEKTVFDSIQDVTIVKPGTKLLDPVTGL